MRGRHLIIIQELLQPQLPKKRCSTTKDFPSHLIPGVFSERFTIGSRNLLLAQLHIKPFDYGLGDLQ